MNIFITGTQGLVSSHLKEFLSGLHVKYIFEFNIMERL